MTLRQNQSFEAELVPVNLVSLKDIWVPNIFIYNLETFKVINVLSPLQGLWIDTDKNVLYSQFAQITFTCPMRFERFPLDTHICKFSVGSYSYDTSRLDFATRTYGYSSKESNNITLDYHISEYILQHFMQQRPLGQNQENTHKIS